MIDDEGPDAESPAADLAGADLTAADLGADLAGADLTAADLGADLTGAELAGANLEADLGEAPPSGLKQAAFFDLDKTVIAKASMVAFGGPLYKGGLINRRTVLRAMYGQLVYLHLGASEHKLERIRESVLRLTRGWSQAQVAKIVEEALEQIIDPIIYAEAADLIDLHRAAGRSVVVVSASPAEIVVPLARYLGADATIASRAHVDEDGRYTGAMEFYAYGEFKAEAMRELAEREAIDLSESYAYSDSYTDLPMLELVGHPVAVNPDRVLAKYAREHGFEVTRFVHPVRLRDRFRGVRDRISAVPQRPAVAVSLGAVAVGASAFVVGWWLGSRRLPSQSRPSRRGRVIS